MFSKPFKAFPIIFKSMFQGLGGLLIGKRMSAGGEALAAGLFAGVINKKIPVWTNTEFKEFIMEENRVTGVIAVQNGKQITLKARKGVILAAGGFDHNLPMRQKLQSPILKNDYSLGSEGNKGDGIFITKNTLEADTSYMKESWWFPAVAPAKPGDPAQVMLAERSLPGSFIVNGKGRRFINEARDYMSFGQSLLKMEEEGNEVKEMWIIFDQKYRNSYIFAGSVFPRAALPKEWYDNKIAFKSSSIAELAKEAGLPEKTFKDTFDRFNDMAKNGKDLDFHRGESAYDRYYGDPKVKPNPNLGKLLIKRQFWEVNGSLYQNIIASLHPEKKQRFIIGAHYDVYKDIPGADDNASAVAGLLEMARVTPEMADSVHFGIDFVAFSLEEPPMFKTQIMGSYVHAKSVFEAGIDVIGMLSLEMIGYYWPPEERQPENKHFLYVSGIKKIDDFNKKISRLLRIQNTVIDSRYVSHADDLKNNGPSDHRNYWKYAFPASMIIGSGKGGNPHYHKMIDTIDTLDFEVMTEAVKSILHTVINF